MVEPGEEEVVLKKIRCPACKGSGVTPTRGAWMWNRGLDMSSNMFPCAACNGTGLIDTAVVRGEGKRSNLEFGASLFICALVVLVSLNVQNLVGTVLFGIALVVGAIATFRFLNA
jgi:hypothetical protein